MIPDVLRGVVRMERIRRGGKNTASPPPPILIKAFPLLKRVKKCWHDSTSDYCRLSFFMVQSVCNENTGAMTSLDVTFDFWLGEYSVSDISTMYFRGEGDT